MLLELVAMPARAGRWASSSAKISRFTDGSSTTASMAHAELRCRACQVRGWRHPASSAVGVGAFEPAFLDPAVEPLTVRRHGTLQMLRVDVDERDVDPTQGGLLSDLRSHGPSPDDEQATLIAARGSPGTHPLTPRPATGPALEWCSWSAPARLWCSARWSGNHLSASGGRA